jgi:Uma2 family endonuclease
VYPDVFVICSERDQQNTQLVRDPVLIIEVLSDSTEAIDLKEKVDAYLVIPGLQAYVTVAQKIPSEGNKRQRKYRSPSIRGAHPVF